MKLIYRLGYYLGGFTIGLIILFFFLGGKKTSCDYGPNARTLKNIRTKTLMYSEKGQRELLALNLDTTAVSKLLNNGDVIFSESQTQLDSCNIYVIEGSVSEQLVKIEVENCSRVATLLSARKIMD
ncbi:hypothetical protein MG296_09790 [Flavobacteriaceae bacterium TK19130]|nr:hypothetical protein [Thermobacterium salinum]